MTYKMFKWKLRNMGVKGYLQSLLTKPVKIDAVYKDKIIFEEPVLIAQGRKAIILKANGLTYENLIRKSLKEKGFYIEYEVEIDDYIDLMQHVFIKVSDKELAAWEAINRQIYSDESGKVRGMAFILSADTDMDQLETYKRYLRRKIGICMYEVSEKMPDGTVSVFKTSITPLHVPDRKRMERECSLAILSGRRNFSNVK